MFNKISTIIKSKTAVSDHISNSNVCKDDWTTVKNFVVSKESQNKFETNISEAILFECHNPTLNKQLTKPGVTQTLRIFG